ncbi:hypothetical protein [Streptomyces sp. WAC01280]|uniref:hypothetical protein n=1 Tax=Streptomyces sp. WAC01280 TaxID=2487424 RepID=UPI000F79FCB6|nr:hypothetical protein [Streptomyces sp. WAC01280]RSS53242.1 hypothetical protein EF909_27480 [Streptomyces sp. WAC01280]
MTPHNELRLLPWSGLDGKPCFLSTDDTNGHLSRLADNTEAIQLGLATQLLEHASEDLSNGEADPEELRALATDLTEALRDTLRVAESRGHRLPLPGPDAHGNDTEVPMLPAAAFG